MESINIYSEGITINKSRTMPVYVKEKENKKYEYYNVAGYKVEVEEKFKNVSKEMSITIKLIPMPFSDFLNEKEFSIIVDTDKYNRYDWKVSNGILRITLYEVINERPDFKRIEKTETK